MAATSSLQDILKSINKKYGTIRTDGTVEPVVTLGVSEQKIQGTLSFRSPGLDYCVYNRIPEGRIIEISGKEGSGKTTCAYLLAASYQQKELERNPENPRKVLYVDLEMTADPSWAIKSGYNMYEDAPVGTVYLTPMDLDGEHILDMVRDFIKTGEVGFIIFDSLPYLVGQQVYDESFEKKEMGGIAKLLTTFVSRITSLLVRYKCTFCAINQLRDNIGGYGLPYTTPGGNAWKFACSLRIMIKRGEFLDEEGNGLTNNAESPWGYRMEMAVLKIKTAKWDRKLGSTVFSYADGVDILQDTIDVATKLGLIDNSVQGTFKLIDPDTKEVLLDEEGNELKVRGKRNVKPFLKDRPELWKRLYDKIYEIIGNPNDPNITMFDAMMNYSKLSLAEDLDFSKSVEDM